MVMGRRRWCRAVGRETPGWPDRGERRALSAQAGAPGPVPVAEHDGRLRTVNGRKRLLDVDASLGGKSEVNPAATDEDITTEGRA
jgi:hypothetical protein